MTLLFFLNLIYFIVLFDLYLLIDLFLIVLNLINLISILYPEKYPLYNSYSSFFILLLRKICPMLPYQDKIEFNKEQNYYYIESKAFFWIILKILFVLISMTCIVIFISLLPFFI
jgi:hypothetical protein